jgi:hypothetical protein
MTVDFLARRVAALPLTAEAGKPASYRSPTAANLACHRFSVLKTA